MAYRTVARSVCEITGLPRLSHSTVRSETTSCGELIEDELFEVGWFALDRAGARPDPAQHLRVSIDGTVIASASKVEFSKFEVIAGRIERDGQPGRRFVCAMQGRSLTRVLIAAALSQSGMTQRTEVDVVNDGARGMRSLVADVPPRIAPRIIDWFHIAMKLQAVRTPIAARKGIWTTLIANHVAGWIDLSIIRSARRRAGRSTPFRARRPRAEYLVAVWRVRTRAATASTHPASSAVGRDFHGVLRTFAERSWRSGDDPLLPVAVFAASDRATDGPSPRPAT